MTARNVLVGEELHLATGSQRKDKDSIGGQHLQQFSGRSFEAATNDYRIEQLFSRRMRESLTEHDALRVRPMS
ncbi:MAG: hypothetical protein ACJAYU_004377 [Bradymonadia bacterium]|jgi:hypothetical protein